MELRLDDDHLVTRAKAGRLDAFEELVRRHRTTVYRIALRMLGDEGEAEDATQEAFVQAWRGLAGFRSDARFSTWIHRIVTNRCLNLLRARKPAEPLPEVEAAAPPARAPERVAEVNWQLHDLKQAIDQLTPEQRAPLVLHDLEGHHYDEIAAMLDISVAAVKSRLHRARLRLLDAMRQWR